LSATDSERIAALVYPLTPQEFMSEKWPGTFQHFTGPAERLAELLTDTGLADVEALVRGPVRGEIRGEPTRPGRSVTRDLTPDRALELYKEGDTIYLTRLANESVLEWVNTLDRAFGLMPGTTQVNAFASSSGPGLNWHWDPQELFIVQIKGSKRWNVAPNEAVEWPSIGSSRDVHKLPAMRHQMNNPGTPIEPPTEWTTIDMVPGSVMYMPRGYWHCTESIDESIHLVLQVKLLSWRDVFEYLLEHVPAFYGLDWRKPSMALAPDQLLDSGLKEFQERCAALSAFATPQGVQALARTFAESRE
jgi:hypothetical protein